MRTFLIAFVLALISQLSVAGVISDGFNKIKNDEKKPTLVQAMPIVNPKKTFPQKSIADFISASAYKFQNLISSLEKGNKALEQAADAVTSKEDMKLIEEVREKKRKRREQYENEYKSLFTDAYFQRRHLNSLKNLSLQMTREKVIEVLGAPSVEDPHQKILGYSLFSSLPLLKVDEPGQEYMIPQVPVALRFSDQNKLVAITYGRDEMDVFGVMPVYDPKVIAQRQMGLPAKKEEVSASPQSRLSSLTFSAGKGANGKVEGIRIDSVQKGGYADTVGLKVQDVIVKINNSPLDNLKLFEMLWSQYNPSQMGAAVMEVRRNGSLVKIPLK